MAQIEQSSQLSAIGGPFTAFPGSISSNGTPLPTSTYSRNGVRLYPNGGTITYSIGPALGLTAVPPTLTSVISGAAGTFVDENLAADQNIYITAVTGSPFYRLM